MNNFSALLIGIFQTLMDPFRKRADRGFDSKPNRSNEPAKRKLPQTIVQVALDEVGIQESGGNNRGGALQKYFDADNYDPNGTKPGDTGYPWCAAFVCWVIHEAMQRNDVRETATFKRPRTAAAWGFEGWSLKQDASTQLKKPCHRDIKAGDIVCLNISHVGIAASDPDEHGYFWTVEGNTSSGGSRDGDGVYSKKRHVTQFRSRIRFTI